MEGVGRTYRGSREGPALSDVSLSIQQGEFVAVTGSSGAGKSTLLNVMGLLDSMSTGRYFVGGRDISELSDSARDRLRAHTFGFVFQDSHMLVKETAGSNAALGLSINNVDPALRPRIVSQALGMVHLLEQAQDLAGNLSGGERQRVAIARAIATSPKILLTDEPTGSLDTANSERVVRILRQLNLTGVTVIMITHDPDVARAASRVLEISNGRIVSDRSQGMAAEPVTTGTQHDSTTLPAGTQSTWSRLCERFGSAVSNHTVHAARAVLLLLAFMVGSGGLVTAIGLSQSAAAQVVGRLDSAGLDEFLVVPKNAPAAIRSEFALSETATASEVAAIATERISDLDGVTAVGLTASAGFDETVTLLDPTRVLTQVTMSPDVRVVDSVYLRLQGIRIEPEAAAHRLFAADAQTPSVILGPELAEKLGYDHHVPGAQVWIGATPAAIVGVIEDLGKEPRLDASLIVNPALARTVFADDPTLIVRTVPGEPARLAERIGVAIAPGDASLFTAETVSDLRSLTRGVAGDLVTLINIVSWVLLALSSLSAATAAYLSVHARAAEVALRRAVGESQRSIWLQFVLEGLIVGFLGGVLGSALGVSLLVLIAITQGWAPTFDLRFTGLGVITGAATGILASLYPAAVAARQDPALAVRGT